MVNRVIRINNQEAIFGRGDDNIREVILANTWLVNKFVTFALITTKQTRDMKILTKSKNIKNPDSPIHCSDPSDYRPELLSLSLGKEKERFRTYEFEVG